MYDLLIKNGYYPDFEKGHMVEKNIGILNGKIVYIGDVCESVLEATEVIDATGLVTSPGFIDIHMHEENFAKEGEKYIISKMMLDMGVTTAVGGNCGVQYQSISEFKKVVEKNGGAPVNYILLVGYNSLRTQLGIGRYDHADEKQISKLQHMIKEELEGGAWGISFGIEYDPGITYEEMLSAIEASGNPNHLIAAHYRADCVGNIKSVEELVQLSNDIKQKFQISHLSSCSAMGMMSASLECINDAILKNPRLNYDTYPYNAFSTEIGSAVFEDGCLDNWGKDYDSILLTDDPYKNIYCTEAIFNKARKEYPHMLAVVFAMNEEEISAAISNINGMIASDAIVNNGNGHPRSAGTFPRVLGKYVRDEKVLSLIDALRKMTLEPARRLGMENIGKIALGCDADITIFNPETIIDCADWTHLEGPKGIEYVLIKGKKAIADGVKVNERLGQFISFKEYENLQKGVNS